MHSCVGSGFIMYKICADWLWLRLKGVGVDGGAMCGELCPCFFPVTVSVIVYDKLIVKLKVKFALLAVSTLINQCFTLNLPNSFNRFTDIIWICPGHWGMPALCFPKRRSVFCWMMWSLTFRIMWILFFWNWKNIQTRRMRVSWTWLRC